MISREEQKKAARERLQKNYDEKDSGNFSGQQILDFTKIGGYKKNLFFKTKEGNNTIDIIPYIVTSENHPQKLKKGIPDYILDLWVHRRVGPSEGQYICLQKTFGKACPICEEREESRKNPDVNEDEIKTMYPKRRCWYNVININLPEKEQKVQIFEESHFLFEKELLEEAGSSKNGFIPFFDIDEGKTIEFRAAEEKSKMGKFMKYKKISFVDRDAYTDEIYKDAYPLDSMYHIPTYEEVRNAFYGVTSDTESNKEEGGPELSAEEDKPVERKRRKVSEESKDSDETQSSVRSDSSEEKVGRRQRKQPEVKPEEKKSTVKCPEGLTFGKDNDEDPLCGNCPNDLWEKCADERELTYK